MTISIGQLTINASLRNLDVTAGRHLGFTVTIGHRQSAAWLPASDHRALSTQRDSNGARWIWGPGFHAIIG